MGNRERIPEEEFPRGRELEEKSKISKNITIERLMREIKSSYMS